MINEKTVIAIIPARGGSKGLPGKNIKPLCGKPLIAWSIEAGLGSQYIDEVMVTTDSQEIAGIARKFGASVPFIRPAELASDAAASMDVIRHVLNFYENKLHKNFDYTVLLEPTSPLRGKEDIDNAIGQLLGNPQASAVVGICKTESQNPAFLVKKNSNKFLFGYKDSNMEILRRQDIKDVYFFEGSVYVSDTATLLTKNTFYHENTLGCEFPKWKSIEIDDLEDFIMVEALMINKRLNI
jgi:CMP-N,N'-diacetyllegionaminic acid synthase